MNSLCTYSETSDLRAVWPMAVTEERNRLDTEREFAKNSRIFAAFAPGANRALQFFFPRKSAFRNSAGIRYANAAANERNLNL
jgi:hypothetical protein